MKLTMLLKLLPTPQQDAALLVTIERFNAACDYIAARAWDSQTFNKVKLQTLVYRDVRERYSLSAQMAVRAVGKVGDSYKRDKTSQPTFRPHGAMIYDERILSFKGLDTASILTLQGRQSVKFVMGGYQRERIAAYGIRGQADLLYRAGTFYLAVVVEVPAPSVEGDDFLGVDLGVVSLASDSDGQDYSGAEVERNRRIMAHRRANLQRKGTKSAKRKLRKLSGKQAGFQRNTNHVISKALVRKAKDTGRGLAVEKLTGIRSRTTVRKPQRARHSNWGFYQLKSFLIYKAALAGVPLAQVDPRNTSRLCQMCGHIAKENRKSQSEFHCVQCGFAANADHNAAVNIRQRALAARVAVMQPMVSTSTSNGGS
ncbi:MAG: RNA-guided endonuclease InsQ/TnpB family protein [Chloroflexia bacterium]